MIPIAIIISLGLAIGILSGKILLSLVLLATIPLTIFFYKSSDQIRIYFIVFSISFPLVLPLLGKDAGTISTFLIFLIALLMIWKILRQQRSISFETIEIPLWAMALLGAFNLALNDGVFITGFRYYYIFLSGLILFLLIAKISISSSEEAWDFIERLLDVILIVIVIQITIGFLVRFYPAAGSWFKIFVRGDDPAGLSWRITDESIGGIARLRTLISGPESTGEILAVLSPLVLYKFFFHRRAIYLIVFILIGCAEVLTATRSTTMLFILGTFLTLLIHAWLRNAKASFKFALAFICLFLCLIMLRPDFFAGFTQRFSKIEDALQQGRSMSSVLNRDVVWEKALKNLEGLPALGHGFLPPSFYGEQTNFHSLYLTILYQMGWLGAPIFYITFLWIYIKVFVAQKQGTDSRLKFLLVCCFISFSLFLINEIKYEFNRQGPYLQLCWGLLGLFYFIASRKKILLDHNLSTSP